MKLLLITILFIVITVISNAQHSSSLAANQDRSTKHGIEVDVIWPFVAQAFRAHYTHTLWQKNDQRGDLLVGISIDFPRDRDTEGRFADYSIATGYRQYFWKGLHAEFNQTTGLGVLEDHVTTGETYKSFDWLMAGYVGYRFNIARKWYAIPQFGISGVVYKSNPWPIYADETLTKEVGEEPFLVGTLRVGIQF
ncbi:MAG: hypothetical protein MUF39_10465 [Cyclobacteriaceae bacterium]|jgi:hypothetical protein|nr:hypothetical protein [Cyclobacteriaceae bacterium]